MGVKPTCKEASFKVLTIRGPYDDAFPRHFAVQLASNVNEGVQKRPILVNHPSRSLVKHALD
jgi:hypothetical protein